MNTAEYFDSRKSSKLIGLEKNFTFFKKLLVTEKFPKVLLLSGGQGTGKNTLINHLMNFYFNKKHYNEEENEYMDNIFTNKYLNNLFPNIVYLDGDNSKLTSIDEIRSLKKLLLKSNISDQKRFIILNNAEKINNNSLNALLKLIEDPGDKNNFILINNKSSLLIETIKSRCIEFKIIINRNDKDKIIKFLMDFHKQKKIFEENLIFVSPGNFLKFNYIFEKNKIDINDEYLLILNKLINNFKKQKDNIYRDLIIYFTEYHFKKIRNKRSFDLEKLLKKRSLVLSNINDFFLYNLNQNTLINSLESKLLNE